MIWIPPYNMENDRYWPILRSGGWESWLTYKHGGEKQGKRLGRTLSEFGIPTKMEVESSHAWRRATSLGKRGDEPFFPKKQRVKERTDLTMVVKRFNDACLLGGVLYTANQFWGRHFCILVSLSGRVGLRQHNTGKHFFHAVCFRLIYILNPFGRFVNMGVPQNNWFPRFPDEFWMIWGSATRNHWWTFLRRSLRPDVIL